MPGITFARKVTKWEVTTNALLANAADLPHLEADRIELQALLAEVMELGNQQIALQSRFQQSLRDVDEKLRQGETLTARLRAGIRAKYGYKSEKLTEFQIRPLRRRVRGSGTAEKTPKPPAPDPTAAA
jgi:hypothetical protein